ncbi:MAG TPA: ABC transporter permease [Burkholderiales bacterium]|nr:ABC transporter permease [Burkholderiales bacterium]
MITSPSLRYVAIPDREGRVELTGAWNLAALGKQINLLRSQLVTYAANQGLHWDLKGVDSLDTVGAALLWQAWGERRVKNLSLRPEHDALFVGLGSTGEHVSPGARYDWTVPVVTIGESVLAFLSYLYAAVQLFGQLALDAAYLLARPSRAPWREISTNIYRAGAQALPITALLGFLIGVVIGYLSAEQLRIFGAGVYIINILGISIIRELGPVLCAILVAGRSGSAMTAQLGVMKITQELDALSVMGISHTTRLILPKVVALAVSLPLLVLWTDAAALLGGMVSAGFELDISYRFFLTRLPDVVPIANLWLGFSKAVVFGLLIGIIACQFGLRIHRDTSSLAIGTTTSVVTSITIVIVTDSIFAVLFSHVGLR